MGFQFSIDKAIFMLSFRALNILGIRSIRYQVLQGFVGERVREIIRRVCDELGRKILRGRRYQVLAFKFLASI